MTRNRGTRNSDGSDPAQVIVADGWIQGNLRCEGSRCWSQLASMTGRGENLFCCETQQGCGAFRIMQRSEANEQHKTVQHVAFSGFGTPRIGLKRPARIRRTERQEFKPRRHVGTTTLRRGRQECAGCQMTHENRGLVGRPRNCRPTDRSDLRQRIRWVETQPTESHSLPPKSTLTPLFLFRRVVGPSWFYSLNRQ